MVKIGAENKGGSMSFEEREKRVLDNLSGRVLGSEEVESAIRKELEKEGITDIPPGRILSLAFSLKRFKSAPGDKFRFK